MCSQQWETLMPRRIEIDDDVFAALQEHAEPLVDAPNDVLRRLLGLDGDAQDRRSAGRSSTSTPGGSAARHVSNGRSGVQNPRLLESAKREPAGRERSRRGAGELLPLEQYCGPILQALAEAGGELRSREIPTKVAPYVESLLYDADRELDGEGAPAWHGRIGWAGTLCRKDGHLDKDAPRGIWRLTAAGRRKADEMDGS